MDKVHLRRNDVVLGRVESREDSCEHLVDLSWVEEALCHLRDVQIDRRKAARVAQQLAWVREELVV